MPVDLRGRHAHVPKTSGGWKCPACNVENVGPLEQGCSACGAGKPGTFKGIDPIVRPKDVATAVVNRVPSGVDAVRVDEHDDVRDRDRVRVPTLEAAFQSWFRPLRDQTPPEVATLAYEAFKAGWHSRLPMPEKSSPEASQPPGTAESRTLIAALRYWAENVWPLLDEEVAGGEYLNLNQINELIVKIEAQA